MTRSIICALMLTISAGASYAQTPDSVMTRELNEVTVEAQLNYVNTKGATVIPSSRQKEAANNAIDLLRQLAMPQIKVKVATGEVTTPTGDPVAIYINYVKASPEEMEGMKTTDVRQVQYMYQPTDPRFGNDRNVINFIVQTYEYGGYTKVMLDDKFFTGRSNRASVYSKFSFKKMTYDLYLGATDIDNHHSGSSIKETFSIPGADGYGQSLTREQIKESSHYANYMIPVTFRASYTGSRFQTQNTVGFSYRATPHNDISGRLLYNRATDKTETYRELNNSRNRYASYNGNFDIALPKEYSVYINPTFSYGHISQHREYNGSTSVGDIINHATEDSYDASIFAMARKVMGGAHYLFLRTFAGYSNYSVSYSGDSPAVDRIIESYAGATMQYSYYTDNISADALIGVRHNHNSTNHDCNISTYPFVSASFAWSPDQRHSLQFYLSCSKEPMEASHKSRNIIRSNELLYYTGNPDLKHSPNIMLNLSYNWIPSGWLQLSPFASYYATFDREVPIYYHYLDGKAILRKFENNGNHYRTSVGLAVTANFLNRKLQLQIMPQQMLYRSTGYYDMSCNPFIFSGSATCYLNRFYISAYYEMGNRTLWTNSGTIYKDRSQFQLNAGWSNGNWNLRLGISNPFRNTWRCATKSFVTPLYSHSETIYGTTVHFNMNCSVTYTFDYGKKVRRNNEVGSHGIDKSAILQ